MLFYPSSLAVTTRTASSSGPSPGVWDKLTARGLSGDGTRAYVVSDDFLVFGQSVAVSSNVGCYVSQAGQYKSFEGSSATLAQLATASGGVIQLGTPATDNIVSAICQGGAGTSAATSVLGALNRDTNPRLTCFETRFKVSSVADDVQAIFVGLMEENGAVTACKVDDTGATIDNDYIGFDTVHTNGGTAGTNAKLRFVYKKDGATAQTVISTLQTMVADTWYKVGFVYDPDAPESKRIACYLDGVRQGTYVTDAAMNASTFPDGEEMGFTAMTKSGVATASNLQLDWWAFGQVAA